MALRKHCLFLQLPSPPFINVRRDWQGGFGTADYTLRPSYGQDYLDDVVPFLPLLRSAAYTKAYGIDIDYLDAQILQFSLRSLIKEILKRNPLFIIVPINLPSLEGDIRALAILKKNLAHLKIIAIGPVVKYLYRFLMKNGVVDVGVYSEPETIMPQLLEACLADNNHKLKSLPGLILKQKERIIISKQALPWEDLDNLPFQLMYQLIPVKKYRNRLFGENESFMPIFTSKGCPYPCSFYCPYPQFYGKKVYYRSLDKVVEEIKYLAKQYGVKKFIFRDQVFAYKRERVLLLAKKLKQLSLGISWVAEVRIENIDEEILKAMKDAGCLRIHVGIENPNPGIFSCISKPGIDHSLMLTKIKLLKESGLSFQTHLIIGFPHEDWQSIFYTANFIRDNSIPYIQVSIATPYPGTEFRRMLLKEKLITDFRWKNYGGLYPVIRTYHLTSKELYHAKLYLEMQNHKKKNLKFFIQKIYRKVNYNLRCLP